LHPWSPWIKVSNGGAYVVASTASQSSRNDAIDTAYSALSRLSMDLLSDRLAEWTSGPATIITCQTCCKPKIGSVWFAFGFPFLRLFSLSDLALNFPQSRLKSQQCASECFGAAVVQLQRLVKASFNPRSLYHEFSLVWIDLTRHRPELGGKTHGSTRTRQKRPHNIPGEH
jgi:hypothetical protein